MQSTYIELSVVSENCYGVSVHRTFTTLSKLCPGI